MCETHNCHLSFNGTEFQIPQHSRAFASHKFAKSLVFAMKLVWSLFLVTLSGSMDIFYAEIGQILTFFAAYFRRFLNLTNVLKPMLVIVGLCHFISSALELETHLKISKCKLEFAVDTKTVNSCFKNFQILAQKFCHKIPKHGYVFITRAIIVLTQLAIENGDHLLTVSYKM